MPTYTLHTNYNAAEVDNRFWLCSSDPTKTIPTTGPPEGGAAPLGRYCGAYPTNSILLAKLLAAARLGISVADIETANYLKVYE